MPLITESHDSLPYIDRSPSPPSLAAAHALIAAELPPAHILATPHPLLPPPPSTFTAPPPSPPKPLTAIDLSRYELPLSSSPDPGSDAAATSSPPLVPLQTAAAHLSARLQALSLLEQHGRNAWLVGNASLEEELRAYEEELAQVKGASEEVLRERKRLQEGARAQIEGGERAWRGAVERLVQVGVGTAAGIRRGT